VQPTARPTHTMGFYEWRTSFEGHLGTDSSTGA